jgi:rod shape-determining protein MreB
VVLDEPSVIAFDTDAGRVAAVGREAQSLVGREPQGFRVLQPIRNGVIADCEAAGQMLSRFINRALKERSLLSPRLLICAPSDITPVEQQAFEKVASRAGASRFTFLAAPLAPTWR